MRSEQLLRSPSRGNNRGRGRNKSISREPHKNHSRYIYDDDTDSRRDSVASNLAEDGDYASISDNFDDGSACGLCEPICCVDKIPMEDRADLDELREIRREIDDMKRMIQPSSVSIVHEDEAPLPPLVRSHSKSPRQGPPSPRMQSNLIIEMKRQESRHGKLTKLYENDLVQVDTRDEQERQRREKYYTSLGKQGYVPPEERDELWTNFLQCSNFCISWNCEKGQDDNMSDITEPNELPWNDDYYRNVIIDPSTRNETSLTMRTSPTMRTETSLALSGYSRNLRSGTSFPALSVAQSRKTLTTKTSSNGSPSSNSKSNASPMAMLSRLQKSPITRQSKPSKVKARKVRDEDTGTVLFEV